MPDSKQNFTQGSDDTTIGEEGDMTDPQVITNEEQIQILPESGSAILTHQVDENGGGNGGKQRRVFGGGGQSEPLNSRNNGTLK